MHLIEDEFGSATRRTYRARYGYGDQTQSGEAVKRVVS